MAAAVLYTGPGASQGKSKVSCDGVRTLQRKMSGYSFLLCQAGWNREMHCHPTPDSGQGWDFFSAP